MMLVVVGMEADAFVQQTHRRVDSLARFLNDVEGVYTVPDSQGWPNLRGLVVDDCFGDDGLFLGKAMEYNATVKAAGAVLTVKYYKGPWWGACMYFYIYSNIPFNGTTTQIVFCKHTLW